MYRDRASAPTTRTFLYIPVRRNCAAVTTPITKPLQAAVRSKATAFDAPMMACTCQSLRLLDANHRSMPWPSRKPHLACTAKQIIWAGSRKQNQVQVAGINARHFKRQLRRASSMLTQTLPLCQYVAFPAAAVSCCSRRSLQGRACGNKQESARGQWRGKAAIRKALRAAARRLTLCPCGLLSNHHLSPLAFQGPG